MSYNGLSYNGLSYNGLCYNGLYYNGLSYNGLSYNTTMFFCSGHVHTHFKCVSKIIDLSDKELLPAFQ